MKNTILFIVACLLVLVVPRAEAWWRVSTYPDVVVSTSQRVPQYEIRQVPVYDAYGNFVGYQSQQVFVGYTYPTTVYRQESFWFSFGNSGHSSRHDYDRDDHRDCPRGHGDYRRHH